MKKAQISGQALIFVLALIVTAAILIFGYNAIQRIEEQQQLVELIKFQNNFKQKINDAAYAYGSSKKVSLVMPKGYDELCVVDKTLTLMDVKATKLFDRSPVASDTWWDENSEDNAFLLKTGSQMPERFYAGNLSVDGDGDGEEDDWAAGDKGFICIKSIGSTLSFIVEGRGRHTLVKK